MGVGGGVSTSESRDIDFVRLDMMGLEQRKGRRSVREEGRDLISTSKLGLVERVILANLPGEPSDFGGVAVLESVGVEDDRNASPSRAEADPPKLIKLESQGLRRSEFSCSDADSPNTSSLISLDASSDGRRVADGGNSD